MCMKKLSSDREHLVLDNQKLVYYLVQKLGVPSYYSEYEDIVSIGTIGLIKAAIAFDASKKFTFSTYAARCINNEIFRYYRKSNKYANTISIDAPIGTDKKGRNFALGDIIEYPESYFFEEIEIKEAFIRLVSIILNYLEGKQRLIMLYRIGEASRADIAEKLNISKTTVSTIAKKTINKIREVSHHHVHYKEVFSMAIVGDEYRISFLTKDICKFNKIFATFLQNLTSTEKLPDFRVNYNGERIVVQIPAHPESFYFIAQIIQQIDDYSMTFVSDKSNDTVAESTIEKRSQVKQVRDYMLSMTSFTVKDLKHHFPNIAPSAINNALHFAKSKGLISSIGRGEYRVNN